MASNEWEYWGAPRALTPEELIGQSIDALKSTVETPVDVISDFLPVVGDVKSGAYAIDDVIGGDYGSAALNAVGLLPFVPSLGIAAREGKNLSKLEEVAGALARSDRDYAEAIGGVVDGRNIMAGPVPNMGSIKASLGRDYEIYPGIREVPMSEFSGLGSPYAADDYERATRLAEEIRNSNEISPLIVVVDEQGPYILEGGHRADALAMMGANSFPAKVVYDTSRILPPLRGK